GHASSLVPAQQDDSHPPLNRTRVPRNRGRFSFKERTRKKVHNPPPKMKQFRQKPYKAQPEAPNNQTSTNKSKAKAKKAPTFTPKPLADMDKNGLIRSMAWHHPTSTLEVGTLSANTKRVFTGMPALTTLTSTTSALDRPDLQQQVMECIQEATRLAAGVKRKAQRLIGQFVETLRDNTNEAEETLR
ncbi:hypothetical protein BGZ58_006272, partial [Dissophora ornata]